jgi:hypothetical protein
MAGIAPQMVAAASALKRQVAVLPPSVADTLQKMRDLLYDSASRDTHPPLCDFSRDPADTWYPYGEDIECRIRHARSPGSEFRKGIHWVFQHDWSTKQQEHSDQLVAPLIQLLSDEAMLQEAEARKIVVDHYAYVYGHFPPPATPPRPELMSRVPRPIMPPPDGGAPEGPLVPMPMPLPNGLPGDEAAPLPDNGVLVPEPAVADEFPWMWVGIGAGALVLIGGVYYMTKK